MKRSHAQDGVRHGEDGHGTPLIGAMLGAVGAIVLAIGAARDTGILTIAGGVVLAVGLVATLVIQHMAVEYGILDRLDKLEKK
jgi:hypothetical protein